MKKLDREIRDLNQRVSVHCCRARDLHRLAETHSGGRGPVGIYTDRHSGEGLMIHYCATLSLSGVCHNGSDYHFHLEQE